MVGGDLSGLVGCFVPPWKAWGGSTYRVSGILTMAGECITQALTYRGGSSVCMTGSLRCPVIAFNGTDLHSGCHRTDPFMSYPV